MSEISKLQLKTTSILKVPIHNYQTDFQFIVNGEEFKTSRLVSDLLSSKICKIHENDPILDTYIINTKYHGNFSYVLNLVNFDEREIPQSELPFILEVFELLGTESINIVEPTQSIKLSVQNVFKQIQKHESFKKFYINNFSEEIEFISSNFSELCESQEEFKNLKIETLMEILSNPKLQLKTENQLLKFVNKLYTINSEMYSKLYEKVHFEYVTASMMREFLEIYDLNDITNQTWLGLSNRLLHEIKEEENKKFNRYKKQKNQDITFSMSNENSLSGIINHLMNVSSGKIENEIKITTSSCQNNEDRFQARNVVLYNDKNKIFMSQNSGNSWICFDFIDKKVIPSCYTMRTGDHLNNRANIRYWVLEGSNDEKSWTTLDSQNNCGHLNWTNRIHTYKLNNQNSNKYRYLKIRSTGVDCNCTYFLSFEAIEFYGKLIYNEE